MEFVLQFILNICPTTSVPSLRPKIVWIAWVTTNFERDEMVLLIMSRVFVCVAWFLEVMLLQTLGIFFGWADGAGGEAPTTQDLTVV